MTNLYHIGYSTPLLTLAVTPEEIEKAKIEGDELELPSESKSHNNSSFMPINHDESIVLVEKQTSDTTGIKPY